MTTIFGYSAKLELEMADGGALDITDAMRISEDGITVSTNRVATLIDAYNALALLKEARDQALTKALYEFQDHHTRWPSVDEQTVIRDRLMGGNEGGK